MRKPTKILSEEHQNILKAVETLNLECDALESGKKLDKKFFIEIIDFIRNYADKFHHKKEEDLLFKELCKDTVQMHCNPVEQMLHEHNLGRDFVKGMDSGLKENNKSKIIKNARGYIGLLQEHIYREDNILYPMADEALSQKVQEILLGKFEKIEKENKSKTKYLALLKKFEKRKNEK